MKDMTFIVMLFCAIGEILFSKIFGWNNMGVIALLSAILFELIEMNQKKRRNE